MPPHIPLIRRVLRLLFILASTTSIRAQTGAWQQQPASGNNRDTAVEVPVKKNYDEDAKSWYAVYNTGNIIHVYLAVTDPLQQRKIVTNGLELWIETKGKKNKKTGILFPVTLHEAGERPVQATPPGFSGPGGFGNHPPDTNNIQVLETAIALQREMKLTGFKEDLNGMQNIHHPSGIQVSLYFIKDTLVYDAQLPVNTLSDPISVNSRMAVCLVEKGSPLPGFDGNEMLPDGAGNGMMPPPGPGPGGEEGMRMFQDNTIWYKFSLHHTDVL